MVGNLSARLLSSEEGAKIRLKIKKTMKAFEPGTLVSAPMLYYIQFKCIDHQHPSWPVSKCSSLCDHLTRAYRLLSICGTGALNAVFISCSTEICFKPCYALTG